MTRSALLTACFMAVAFGAHLNAASEDSHRQWLQARYEEAVSVKPGMTRADLRRLFSPDGGVQRIPAGRYVLKSCRMIKVDVEFAVPEGLSRESLADQNEPADETLQINGVSKPYLERAFTD